MSQARVDAAALSSSLRRLAEQRDRSDLFESLKRVIDASGQLFAVTGGGLMLADEQGDLRYIVATSEPSRALERVQLETGEGPCVDTYVRDEVVVTADVAVDTRWPNAGPPIAEHGIGAVLGVPIHLAEVTVGSLDLYVDVPYKFDDSEIEALARYGDVVEAMLHAAVTASAAGQLADQLAYALDYRAPIERGIGYLMARDQLQHAEAFGRLRSAARSSRRKIGEVAAELLETGRLPDESRQPRS